MLKKIIFCMFVLAGTIASAQNNDPILFTAGDQVVRVSEFDYIYNKNNGDNADYSKKSLEEYLDLYVKFKLKVQRARDMKLDTIVSLQKELQGYRKQLAKSYLNDKEVVDGLIREIFERKKKDIRVSHILVSVKDQEDKEELKKAYEKALQLKERVESGTPFEDVAKRGSEDRNSASNGGDIGFITAKLPDGFYEFENAIYTLKKGELSDPVLSKAGYHIVKVTDERPARGEIEVSHILIRKKNKGQVVPNAKEIADSLYNELMKGGDFNKMVKLHSQDMSSVNKGGYVGSFGINQYQKSFEEAAFSIPEDGAYTKPVETAVGFHIIKRLSKSDVNDFETVKKKIQKDVQRDSRLEIAKKTMIKKIKENANYTENREALDKFINQLDDEFFSYKWELPALEETTLISFDGNMNYSLKDFANYCKKNTRKRLRFDKGSPIDEAVESLFEDYVNEKCTVYEEKNLENKYPEFKALMREYEEGILLFEATKMKVWDKASQDTVGLNKFFANNRENFVWNEKAIAKRITAKTDNKRKAKKMAKCARKESVEELLARYNKEEEMITVEDFEMEKTGDVVRTDNWKAGYVSSPVINEEEGTTSFYKIIEIEPRRLKTMDEARGYIIADYQDYLEKEWVSELREAYKVNINEKVFNSLIKK